MMHDANSDWLREAAIVNGSKKYQDGRGAPKEGGLSAAPVFQFYSLVFTASAQEIFATDR